MKRPQSAVTNNNSTAAKISFGRPQSGVSDQTMRFSNVEQLINKATYSLQLNNITDSLALFEQAFKMAAHQISSIRLIKLLDDVLLQLIKALRSCDDKFGGQMLVNKMLIWSQVQESFEDVLYIRCPPITQVKVLNAYADYQRKIHNYDESTTYLQLALQMLTQIKHEQSIDDIIGQTYLYLSTNSLYKLQYTQAIKESQSALTHLQQAIILNKLDEEVNENMCDAYINLAIAKEHEKQFQEAHYNYYSSLVFAQQNLNQDRIMRVQQIYDQFLSRQATYLQRISYSQQKQFKSLKQLKPPQQTQSKQPFIDLVKNMHDNRLTPTFFKKKQRVLHSLEKLKQKKQIQSIEKFRPYLSKQQSYSQQSKVRMQIKSPSPPKHQKLIEKTFVSNVSNGVRILKVQKQTGYQQTEYKQNTIERDDEDVYQQPGKIRQSQQHQSQPYLPQATVKPQQSSILQYLENILNNLKLVKQQNVQQIQHFPNIHLPSTEQQSGVQIIFAGTMSLHLFTQQNLLYLQYKASEMVDQFTINSQYNQSARVIGLSLNISDVINSQLHNNDAINLKTFLLNFSIELFKYAKINSISFQLPLTSANQFYVYVQQSQQHVLIQFKNEYEALVFLVDQPDDMQLLQHCKSSKSMLSDDIQPLLAEQLQFPTQNHNNDEIIHPVLGIIEDQDERVVSSVEYSQEFEDPVPLIDQANHSATSKMVHKSHSLPPQKGMYDGMEKFTIKIESEDQKQKEVIEVYAEQKNQQEQHV